MTDTARDRPIPGERDYAIEPAPPPLRDDDPELRPPRTDTPVLTPADLVWIQSLDADRLDAGDVSALRQLRNRASRGDERRLLDRVLRADDAARAEADRRAPLEHEIRTIENMLKKPEMTTGRRLILEQRAEAVVRRSIAEAVADANRDYARDPRRIATILATGEPDTITRTEAEREHAQRIAGIEAAHDRLYPPALIDVERLWHDEYRANQIRLATRKQELQRLLDDPNAQNGHGSNGSA
jgi:hypothetical protein